QRTREWLARKPVKSPSSSASPAYLVVLTLSDVKAEAVCGSRTHVERRLITETLEQYYRDRSDVCTVYLFGSQASGSARSVSDVDVGVLYKQTPPSTLVGQPFLDEAELTERLGTTVQIVVMNTAPVDLVHRILRARCIVLDKDTSKRIRFEVSSRNKYFDLKP